MAEDGADGTSRRPYFSLVPSDIMEFTSRCEIFAKGNKNA